MSRESLSVLDGGRCCSPLDGVAAAASSRAGGVTLARSDHFAVRRLQAEAEATGSVLVHLELGCQVSSWS